MKPRVISTPISWLGNTVHGLATKFHLIPLGNVDVEAGGYTQVPGGARAEAERRRYEHYLSSIPCTKITTIVGPWL